MINIEHEIPAELRQYLAMVQKKIERGESNENTIERTSVVEDELKWQEEDLETYLADTQKEET